MTSVYASIAPACKFTLLPTVFSQHSLSVETNVSSNLITTRPITLGCSDQEKVTGSHFDIGCIVAAVRFVTEGAISMRASSRVCGIIFQLAGCKPFEYPSHTTVQNFLLRICLYLLQQNSQRHDDWVWIADHTYSVGTVKVCASLGIRRSHFVSLQGPVQHQDLVVLAMIPPGPTTSRMNPFPSGIRGKRWSSPQIDGTCEVASVCVFLAPFPQMR